VCFAANIYNNRVCWLLSGVVVVIRYRFDFTIGNAKSKLPLVLESVVHCALTRSRHHRRRRKVNRMDFGFCFLRECDSQRCSCVPFVFGNRAPRARDENRLELKRGMNRSV